MENERLEFKEAIFKLADDFGIQVPVVATSQIQQNYVARDFEIIEKINQFFEKNLYQETAIEARNYLKKRGFNSTIAKKFHIGYALNSYEGLLNHLRNQGFSDSEIEGCGVIGKNDKGKLYDKLRNRITFAISDRKNRLIAFGGRTLGDDLPKYLNSAETEIFKKNQTLYNYSNARKAIFDNGCAIMVEGYVDAISLANNGFENVVAGLGTAIGEEHLKQLFQITDKIIMCLDGDNAGVKAAKRVLEIALPLINSKKTLAFNFLPNQMDPDDFLKNYGAREFKKILDEAVPLSKAMFDFAVADLGLKNIEKLAPESKARLELELNAKINLITDPASKKYFNLFAKDALFSIGRPQNNFKKNIFKTSILPKKNRNNFDQNSLLIMAMLIKYPELINYRDNDFDLREMQFEDEKMSDIKEFIVNLIDENCQNIVEELEKSDFKLYNKEIKNIFLLREKIFNGENIKQKYRLLLLKDLFVKVERQYLENLNAIDEVQAHQNKAPNQKEIFDYKESLQSQIRELEKEIL
jgi:DNA primase